MFSHFSRYRAWFECGKITALPKVGKKSRLNFFRPFLNIIKKRRKIRSLPYFRFFSLTFKNRRKMRNNDWTGKFASSWRSGVNCVIQPCLGSSIVNWGLAQGPGVGPHEGVLVALDLVDAVERVAGLARDLAHRLLLGRHVGVRAGHARTKILAFNY